MIMYLNYLFHYAKNPEYQAIAYPATNFYYPINAMCHDCSTGIAFKNGIIFFPEEANSRRNN